MVRVVEAVRIFGKPKTLEVQKPTVGEPLANPCKSNPIEPVSSVAGTSR